MHCTAAKQGQPKARRQLGVKLRTYSEKRSILLHRVPDARWFNAQRAKAAGRFLLRPRALANRPFAVVRLGGDR